MLFVLRNAPLSRRLDVQLSARCEQGNGTVGAAKWRPRNHFVDQITYTVFNDKQIQPSVFFVLHQQLQVIPVVFGM
jgi:hypothetical protein